MADMGDLGLQVHNFSFNMTWETFWNSEDQKLLFTVSDVSMELDELYTNILQMNGIADFVESLQEWLDLMTTFVKGRV